MLAGLGRHLQRVRDEVVDDLLDRALDGSGVSRVGPLARISGGPSLSSTRADRSPPAKALVAVLRRRIDLTIVQARRTATKMTISRVRPATTKSPRT